VDVVKRAGGFDAPRLRRDVLMIHLNDRNERTIKFSAQKATRGMKNFCNGSHFAVPEKFAFIAPCRKFR
jgi:hypothetical protein